jgi:hypothetical protein
MSGPRGLNLSGTQVIASVLATLTGAIAASYLGVAGTLVGAAVGSLSSTMGTEIYKHYLQRSQERLRTAGQVVLHHPGTAADATVASGTAPEATVGGRHAASAGSASRPAAGGEAERDTAVWDRRQYGAPRDPHETELIPGVATGRGGVPSDWSPNGGTTNGGSPYGRTASGSAANGSGANGGGRPGDTASSHAHGQLTGEGPAGDDAVAGSLWGAVTSFFSSLTRRQWLTYGGIAAGFFVIVVAAIIVFQLAVGKPVLGSPSSTHSSQPTTHPSSTPSATPTGSTPASPTSSASTGAGTPTSSSGTPSPGTSGTASSPSTVPSPTPSTGSSGAARSTTTVTPTP